MSINFSASLLGLHEARDCLVHVHQQMRIIGVAAHTGQEVRAPYTADYLFYGPK